MRRQHDAGADGRDADAGVGRRSRGGLPVGAHAGEEVVAGRRRLVEGGLVARAVVAHRRSRHEDPRPIVHRRQRRGEQRRAGDAGLADLVLVLVAPAVVADPGAGEVDHGVDARQRRPDRAVHRWDPIRSHRRSVARRTTGTGTWPTSRRRAARAVPISPLDPVMATRMTPILPACAPAPSCCSPSRAAWRSWRPARSNCCAWPTRTPARRCTRWATSVRVGDLDVTVLSFTDTDGTATAELRLGGVDDPDGVDDFRLVVPGRSLAPTGQRQRRLCGHHRRHGRVHRDVRHLGGVGRRPSAAVPPRRRRRPLAGDRRLRPARLVLGPLARGAAPTAARPARRYRERTLTPATTTDQRGDPDG